MPYNSPDDKRWLAAMGVALESSDDVHALCHRRWIEERQKREIAEESIVANAAAYSALTEIREAEIWLLMRALARLPRYRSAAITACWIAVIACLALVVTWAVR
jgi:fructose-1,6-bisphosphatase/inositol monophosphatase family enzyme